MPRTPSDTTPRAAGDGQPRALAAGDFPHTLNAGAGNPTPRLRGTRCLQKRSAYVNARPARRGRLQGGSGMFGVQSKSLRTTSLHEIEFAAQTSRGNSLAGEHHLFQIKVPPTPKTLAVTK